MSCLLKGDCKAQILNPVDPKPNRVAIDHGFVHSLNEGLALRSWRSCLIPSRESQGLGFRAHNRQVTRDVVP